jgi:hypothetical protein
VVFSEVATGVAAGVGLFLVLVLMGSLSGWLDPGTPLVLALAGAISAAVLLPRLRAFVAGAVGGVVAATMFAAWVVVVAAHA